MRLEEKERYLSMVEQGLEEIKRRKHERKPVFKALSKVD